MIGTAVEAPGDAPSSPEMEPSAEVMTSVPNCSTPPFLASFFMTCTRWPAVMRYQSSSTAVGMNSRRAASFFLREARSSPMRYFMRSPLSRATASMGPMLCGRTESGRSSQEPFLRNFGLKPA